jgi:hypothetical protein
LSDSGSKKASSCHSFSSYIPLLHFVLVTTASAETWNANSSTCDCLTVDCSAIKHFSLAKETSKRTGARAPPIRSDSASNCQLSIRSLTVQPGRTFVRIGQRQCRCTRFCYIALALQQRRRRSLPSSYPLSFISQ